MKYLRFVYDFIIFIVFSLGIIKLIQGNYYLAFVWIILVPLLMLLPRNLYKIVKKNYKTNLVDFFEILILILLLTSIGYTLYFKNIPIDFDSFSHIINLIIYTIIFAVIYAIIDTRNYKNLNKNKVIIVAVLISLIFGIILWEKFQYYGDQVLGTQMYFDKFQDVKLDSMLDQIFGSLGTLTGALLLYNRIDDWMKIWKK